MKPAHFSTIDEARQYAASKQSEGFRARIEPSRFGVSVWVWSREGEYA